MKLFIHPKSTKAACEVCCLPGWLHLEWVNNTSDKKADSCQLELDQDRWSVTDCLDRAPTHCRELPAAGQVQMQVRMLWSIQILMLWYDLHGTEQLQMQGLDKLYYTHPDSKTICGKKVYAYCLPVYQILYGTDSANDMGTCYPNYDSETVIMVQGS